MYIAAVGQESKDERSCRVLRLCAMHSYCVCRESPTQSTPIIKPVCEQAHPNCVCVKQTLLKYRAQVYHQMKI